MLKKTATHKQLTQGAALLAISSLLVKILSAVYRVPFQNLVGDEGFYVYQQVYPIYGIAMTLALSGLPVFISKLVAEQDSDKKKREIVTLIFPLYFWLSLVAFLLTFLGKKVIANWMGDPELAPIIGIVAIVFLLTPFLTSYRGYYQGQLLLTPTAYSQVVEQVMRVGIILVAAYIFTKRSLSIYQMGTLAMSGSFIGGLGALIILKKQAGETIWGSSLFSHTLDWQGTRIYWRRFIVEGGLICGYSALLVLFQLVDSFVIKNQLVAQGLTNLDAKVIKGAYDRGQPLIQVGMVIGVAYSTAFMPKLTKLRVENKQVLYQKTVGIFIRTMFVIASAASIGLMMLLPYINVSLFGDNAEEEALIVLMGTVFLMSLILVFQTIYQSCNSYRSPLIGLLVGMLVKVLTSHHLTYYFGTIGASVSSLLGLLSCLIWLVYKSPNWLKKTMINIRFIWQLGYALGMMVVSLGIYRLLVSVFFAQTCHRGTMLFLALFGVMVGGFTFVTVILLQKMFTVREWLSIPLGKKILKIGKKVRLK
ncbi:putative polysaccharide biosynthesis protein [Vagococcus intermedius]|uniref:Oligosaccharide flippase family protein n=1 Tax=Vagococcus intermedius TaxID=2991418 RepID=A0AAF0CUQ6_9ENTE|nr:oligosaccharide flippase family protein [Vagococcus intermedius]WEG73268.1 oligosaccharide flippase family protein [Vagococcus intermedius]WEG75350.1 oligosaccharide flippase family protein [Vagococcus intermedius]